MKAKLPSLTALTWMVLIPAGLLPFVFAKPPVNFCVQTAPPAAHSSLNTPIALKQTTPPARGFMHNNALIIPVQGVARKALTNTWGQARAQGRTHQGIDIMAAQGTPVYAAVDGTIVKFYDSARGGITIYQYDRAQQYVYYYAHLSGRAANLIEGEDIRQGQIIGYVGATGNATTPHLHFEIEKLGPEREWWRAQAMNPYPFLLIGHPPA